jgi:chemosensory pili system protein ChpA (sensor histidine kinase/response regulator)
VLEHDLDVLDDLDGAQDIVIEPVLDSMPAPILESIVELVSEPAVLALVPSFVSTAMVTAAATAAAPLLPITAAPLKVVYAQETEIDTVDQLDEDLLVIFEEEAGELLPTLGTALRKWVDDPSDSHSRTEVLHVLHTLKGSARLTGAMRLGEMAHRMESSIADMGLGVLQSLQIEPLLIRFDQMQAIFQGLFAAATVEDAADIEPTPQSIQTAQVTQAAQAAQAARLQSTPESVVTDVPLDTVAASVRQPARAHQASNLARQTGSQTVRVRSGLLDRLVNQAGEVLIARARLEVHVGQLRASLRDLNTNLERLRYQLRDIELQSESQMQSRLAQTKETTQGFDPLEFDRFTRVQELTRMMAESVHDVATVQRNLQKSIEGAEDDLIAQGRQARELQRDLLRTRMVEFENIAERLYGVVRQSSKETGKQVKLDISGGTIEMDRGMLERMATVFEHILRNSVSHGIESVEQRISRGKAAIGTVSIQVSQERNDIWIMFHDDGGGLHLEKIRAKAVANGVIRADEVLTEGEAANLIFRPGFSTAEQVTELSGRGVGMDIVRTEVNALGGRIETTTELGKGTTFKIVLPLTTAVTQVVMLRMGEMSIGVPAGLIDRILRVPEQSLLQAYDQGGFIEGTETLPFFWAGALLQISHQSGETVGKTRSVLVFRSAGQRIAIHVDEVLGNQEVVVKNMGPQLSQLPGLAGVSVLPSGAVSLIYNPVALAAVYGNLAQELSKLAVKQKGIASTPSKTAANSKTAAESQIPLILVVDDSITVRRVTQRLLKREGYRVALATDGLNALEKLQEEKPTLVLSDIEMPRMDGFDLARNIRSDPNLRDLPIIMITSRIATKHKEHAQDLGVDHYLGKPYSEDELLRLIRSYCAEKAAS